MGNNIDNKSDEQFLIIQSTIDSHKQDTDEIKMNTDEKLTQIIENFKVLTAFMMDQTNNSKLSPSQKDTLTPPVPTTVVPDTRRAPPLEGVQSTKSCGMWTLNHKTSSLKFYEILINK